MGVFAMRGKRLNQPPRVRQAGATILLLLLGCGAAWGQVPDSQKTSQTPPGDLTQVSIENLMNMEVTSVSKKEQKMSQVAAAIFVITQEDIHRSGATNIPDLLRMAPGMDVTQINANTWAISVRGFNSQFSDKLLVLIDGRAIYTPLLGEVSWDTQDVPLEDIERIEVIRGPGGTIWGANAVNGVINIIMKKAGDTLGTTLVGGGGTQAQGFGTVQYGGKIREDTSYRIFAKYLNNNHFPNLQGQNGHDGWHLLHGGFRADTDLSGRDSLTTEGDLYTGSEGAVIVHSVLAPPDNLDVQRLAELSGGNVLTRWNHIFSSRSDTTVQFYFDRYTRSGPQSREARDTIDFEFQNHLKIGNRQDLVWGLGYRHSADQTVGTIDQAFVPANWSGHSFNWYVQDQITLKRNRVDLFIGTKLEKSYFTGLDLQPSVRLTWTPTERDTFWAAVSRSTSTPTRRERGLNAVLAVLPGPAEVVLLGNPEGNTEHVISYELGYRTQPSARLSFDLAAFFNNYRGLETIEPLPSFTVPNSNPPLLILPRLIDDKMRGTTEGIEAILNWKVTSRWSVSPGYALLKMHLHTEASSLDTTRPVQEEGSNPAHQAQIRSHVALPRGIDWDASAYFTGRLAAQSVASYTRLDMQLTWRLAESGELSLVGQNLLRDHHVEFNDDLAAVDPSQVKRSVYAKLTWHF
jgi:iron complex outermembrane receptor protein